MILAWLQTQTAYRMLRARCHLLLLPFLHLASSALRRRWSVYYDLFQLHNAKRLRLVFERKHWHSVQWTASTGNDRTSLNDLLRHYHAAGRDGATRLPCSVSGRMTGTGSVDFTRRALCFVG